MAGIDLRKSQGHTAISDCDAVSNTAPAECGVAPFFRHPLIQAMLWPRQTLTITGITAQVFHRQVAVKNPTNWTHSLAILRTRRRVVPDRIRSSQASGGRQRHRRVNTKRPRRADRLSNSSLAASSCSSPVGRAAKEKLSGFVSFAPARRAIGTIGTCENRLRPAPDVTKKLHSAHAQRFRRQTRRDLHSKHRKRTSKPDLHLRQSPTIGVLLPEILSGMWIGVSYYRAYFAIGRMDPSLDKCPQADGFFVHRACTDAKIDVAERYSLWYQTNLFTGLRS